MSPPNYYPLALTIIAVLSFLFSALGASVGLVLGQVRLPMLVALLGPTAGAPTSLAISAMGALIGTIRHAKDRRVDHRLLLSFGVPSAIAAFTVSYLSPSFSSSFAQLAIGLTLIISGLLIYGGPVAKTQSGTKRKRKQNLLENAFIGIGLGSLSGLVGLLLGSLRLPIFIGRLRIDPLKAVGTNMAVGCITGLWGAFGALANHNLDPVVFVTVGAATMLGAFIGARFTGHMAPKTLRYWIAIVVSFSGIVMIVQSFSS